MLFQLSLSAQDDFSLTYNPFNQNTIVDSSTYYVPEDYYMDVPVLFLVYDNSKDNYLLIEGLVIFQAYHGTDCPEEIYWDFLDFTTLLYRSFSRITYDILGYRIITEQQYEDQGKFEYSR